MEINILEKCKEYMKEGKFEKAQIILRRALDENPNQAKVLELCGDLSFKSGRNDEAIARYEHASENYTNNNQYPEAIICLEKILKIDKANETAFYQLVDLYRFLGLPNEAIKKIIEVCTGAMENKDDSLFITGLRKIVELQPKNLSLRLSFAKILLSLNRGQEAQDELKKLKGFAQELGDEGIISEIMKLSYQYDGGEKLDPKSRVELGNLLYEIGSKDEAIVEFNRAASDLIQENRIDEAIGVLNRIVEIDPNNTEALNKIKELKTGPETKKEEIAAPEVIPEPVPEVKPVVSEVEPMEPLKIQEDLDILQELGKEINGFSVAQLGPTEEAVVEMPQKAPPEEITPLEGQIADIEFLLKEAEAPPLPSFELQEQFSEFRSNITWESEDLKKKLTLAKLAFEAELYEKALNYIKEDKDKKDFWPFAIEIIGGALVKLGNYSEAINIIVPIILLENIPDSQKVALRYWLASAYEGLGDFENVLREIEHIMAIDPDYRDVREIYELLGGKMKFEEPVKAIVSEPAPQEVKLPEEEIPPQVIERPTEETYPVIIEEPSVPEPVPATKVPTETIEVEEKGENIMFL